MVFADVVMLRVLSQGEHPVLLTWALNVIASVLIRERQKEIRPDKRGGGTVTREPEFLSP